MHLSFLVTMAVLSSNVMPKEGEEQKCVLTRTSFIFLAANTILKLSLGTEVFPNCWNYCSLVAIKLISLL